MDKESSEEIIEYIFRKYKENTEEDFLNFLFQNNIFDEEYPVILSLIFLPEINNCLKKNF